MTGRVAHIWRHPIKAHGREALDRVALEPGRTLPWDRTWAVAHDRSDADGAAWAPCGNFSRAARVAALQAIEAQLDETSGQISLTHPDLPPIRFRPDDNPQDFLDWANRLMPGDGLRSARLVRARAAGMTDTDFPSISILSLASHRAVASRMGRDISPKRWRGNIFLDRLAPWEEFDWIGKRIRIGSATFLVREAIGRCQATSVDPATGRRDTDMLRVLSDGLGHTNFGVYATVETAGTVALGDPQEVL